ncbi:hypothetical protein [Anoxybacter fermentans]|nr:hypothetical protein [Anoxybacter fermentans]
MPAFKDFSEIKPPSWKVNVAVPVYKGESLLKKAIDESKLSNPEKGITFGVEGDTYVYTYENNINPYSLEGALGEIDTASFNFEYTKELGALKVTTNILANYFNSYGDTLTQDTLVIPSFEKNWTTNTGYIPLPFTRARISNYFNELDENDKTNKLIFTLKTTEPIDYLNIKILGIVDANGNPLTCQFGKIGGDNDTVVPEVTLTKTISLAGSVITENIDLDITLGVHSSKGSISLDIELQEIEIVELEGFLGDVSLDESTFQISGLNPLRDNNLGIDSITFESGKIEITTTYSGPDNNFPFQVTIQEIKLGNNLFQNDINNNLYIDLTNMTLDLNADFSGTITINPTSINTYDVWDENTNQLIPYKYTIKFSMANVKVKSITGNVAKLTELIYDPNPATPEWDFLIEESSPGKEEIPYPEELKEFEFGLPGIYIELTINNNTDFAGDLTLTVTPYADATGTPATDKDGNVLPEAVINIQIPARTGNEGYIEKINTEPILDMFNNRVPYMSFSISGNLYIAGEKVTISTDDSIAVSMKVSVPILLKIPAGGSIFNILNNEKITLSADDINTIEQIAEFIEEAYIHIPYQNGSTLGFGPIFTFSDGVNKVTLNEKNTVLYPKEDNQEFYEGELIFGINKELIDIIKNENGFYLTVDLKIPNESDKEREMKLEPDAFIKYNIYLTGKINAHVPEDI